MTDFSKKKLTDILVNPHANVQVKTLDKALLEEQERQLAEFKGQTVAGPDDTGINAHRPLSPEQLAKAHVTEKVFMFPESYNQLRKELSTYYPNLWQLVGYRMAHNAVEFVEHMNAALELNLQFDSNKIDAICTTYLNELRKKRGVSSIH